MQPNGWTLGPNELEMIFDKCRRVARWEGDTTVDILVTISRMKLDLFWDDEVVRVTDDVDNYVLRRSYNHNLSGLICQNMKTSDYK